jgi:hypothetical protein
MPLASVCGFLDRNFRPSARKHLGEAMERFRPVRCRNQARLGGGPEMRPLGVISMPTSWTPSTRILKWSNCWARPAGQAMAKGLKQCDSRLVKTTCQVPSSDERRHHQAYRLLTEKSRSQGPAGGGSGKVEAVRIPDCSRPLSRPTAGPLKRFGALAPARRRDRGSVFFHGCISRRNSSAGDFFRHMKPVRQ